MTRVGTFNCRFNKPAANSAPTTFKPKNHTQDAGGAFFQLLLIKTTAIRIFAGYEL
jgi:hypothetical protein